LTAEDVRRAFAQIRDGNTAQNVKTGINTNRRWNRSPSYQIAIDKVGTFPKTRFGGFFIACYIEIAG